MSKHEKKIYMQVIRLDLKDVANFSEEDVSPNGPVKEIRISEDSTLPEIKDQIKYCCKIKDESLILKLRNHRGSLIVFTSKIATNSKTVPYVLEVTRPHQTVQAQTRTVTRTKHMETLKRTIHSYIKRLDRLDFEVPSIDEKRSEKIKKDLEEVDAKLQFMNKRIDEADTKTWQGMFKKVPLW